MKGFTSKFAFILAPAVDAHCWLGKILAHGLDKINIFSRTYNTYFYATARCLPINNLAHASFIGHRNFCTLCLF
jgi:hypothetical protein